MVKLIMRKVVYTIYMIVDPRTNEPFYVGQTKSFDTRVRDHLRNRNDGSCWVRRAMLRAIKAAGYTPKFVELDTAKTEEEALEKETKWITTLATAGYRSLTSDRKHNAIINAILCPPAPPRKSINAIVAKWNGMQQTRK